MCTIFRRGEAEARLSYNVVIKDTIPVVIMISSRTYFENDTAMSARSKDDRTTFQRVGLIRASQSSLATSPYGQDRESRTIARHLYALARRAHEL